MKGALVEFASTIGALTPNLIVFQFNPETLRHTWTQAQPPTPPAGAAAGATTGGNPLAVQGVPGETFSFTLAMDVTDQLAEGELTPVGQQAADIGIYARIAALELLLFPVKSMLPPVKGRSVPALVLPTVLFVWGKGRCVPVRVTSLVITEKLFDANLNPTHADAVIELKVLTPDELRVVTGPLKELARAAYHFTQTKREERALENLLNVGSGVDLPRLPGL